MRELFPVAIKTTSYLIGCQAGGHKRGTRPKSVGSMPIRRPPGDEDQIFPEQKKTSVPTDLPPGNRNRGKRNCCYANIKFEKLVRDAHAQERGDNPASGTIDYNPFEEGFVSWGDGAGGLKFQPYRQLKASIRQSELRTIVIVIVTGILLRSRNHSGVIGYGDGKDDIILHRSEYDEVTGNRVK
ncbi:hypothetical protein MTO96_051041 [Rhipicephalus appendiculatus]